MFPGFGEIWKNCIFSYCEALRHGVMCREICSQTHLDPLMDLRGIVRNKVKEAVAVSLEVQLNVLYVF